MISTSIVANHFYVLYFMESNNVYHSIIIYCSCSVNSCKTINKPLKRREYKNYIDWLDLKFCTFFRLSPVLHHSTSMLAGMNPPSLCYCHNLLQFCLSVGSEAMLDLGVYLSFHPVTCTYEQIKCNNLT